MGHLVTLTLDGVWEFMHLADEGVATPLATRPITVPGPWQAQFPDLRMRSGAGFYRRTFDAPEIDPDKRVFLRFGAVFHNCRVWINEHLAGSHEGGFLPFSFDITDHLAAGTNEIKVRAESPTDDATEFPDSPLAEIPFGKQSWYGPLSGIWQSVFLEVRLPDHIERAVIRADLASGEVAVRVLFARPSIGPAQLTAAVKGPDGTVVAFVDTPVAEGQQGLAVALSISGPLAWSPSSPTLYTLDLCLRRAGKPAEEREEAFGFRTIETRDGRLLLNGEPLYLRGALDQDYYPDTICTTPSVEFLEDQFRKAKELGLNCLRCHIKAPDPRYYDVADRIGLLIWTELPNGGLSTDRSRVRKEATLKGIVDRDGNHPSIICWTIINENWGVDLVHDEEHRSWLRRTYLWLKGYDPTRLVVDNSPLAPSFHVETDLADYHFYAAIPDSRGDWDTFVEDLARRPSWLFSPEGDAIVTGTEPILCSEFGNWGLPYPAQLRDADGQEPWWFETGHDWGEGIMYAHGVENRFRDWNLDRAFGSLGRFVEAAQWQQYRALKYEIEAMRRQPSLAGYVITELTDCHWESNGLLDMRRNPRVFHRAFAEINADTVIVPRWDRRSYWSGETATVDVHIAHGAGEVLADMVLEVSLATREPLPLPPIEAGTVCALGTVNITIPEVATAQRMPAVFELKSRDGRLIARNELDLSIHPRHQRAPSQPVRIWCPEPELSGRFAEQGYFVSEVMEAADLVVATVSSAAISRHVRQGGRLLLLPEADGPVTPFFPHWQAVRVQSRAGTLWKGDWASTFSWLRRTSAFQALPGGPLLDEPFDRVIPNRVIVGANLIDFQARVSAAMVIGWIHKPVAITIERSYGQGRMVCSTFRLFRDPPGADPTATVLLDALIGLAAGSRGEPRVAPIGA